MFTHRSIEMMKKSFEKTAYRYAHIAEYNPAREFGVYVHIPFCLTKCRFCPFYKEIYSEDLKNKYIEAIVSEIKQSQIKGKANWVYFGGGTPNTLPIEDIKTIVGTLASKIKISSMGIELLPDLVTNEYLSRLKDIGFTKISIGIESLSSQVISSSRRKQSQSANIKKYIEFAKNIGLWVSVDLMVGLPKQDEKSFLDDVYEISNIKPNQITIYPYMVIGKVEGRAGINEKRQFELIEEAQNILLKKGYQRKNIWIFALGDEIYDSSRDELIEDYAGFGAAAFSTYGNWKIVNPELDIYINNYNKNNRMGLVAEKTKSSDDWRRFARMIYDMNCKKSRLFPWYINLYINMLMIAGYARKGRLTQKGIMFAHELTKTVVESLPYPLQNTHKIINYDEYMSDKHMY